MAIRMEGFDELQRNLKKSIPPGGEPHRYPRRTDPTAAHSRLSHQVFAFWFS